MTTEQVTILVAVIAATPGTITAIALIIKNRKLSCAINILNMRVNMVQTYQNCEKQGFRTKLDSSIFYEMYEFYTKKLKQNSYICRDVEPAFSKLEKR